MTISIPYSIITKYQEVCDFFLSSNIFSRDCKVYYPPIRVVCDSHPFSSTGNIYQHGGPANNIADGCIYCGGQGYKDQEVSETIRLRIYWNKKKWIQGGGINIADADVQVIGALTNLPKIIQADSIELVNDQNQLRGSYKLFGTPFYHGFEKNRYFVAHLKQV